MAKKVPVGTIKEMGGRKYIMTTDGYKYYGSGKGKKAAEYHSSSKNSKSEEGSGDGGKSIDDHAKDTPTEKLEAVLKDDSKSEELKAAAKKELESRGGEKESKEEGDSKDGLPNEESVKESDILAEKDGADKLSEAKEGFSVKDKAELTSTDGDHHGEDDINHKFEAFGRFASGVIKGRMKSLIAYGSGGVGKTYTVTTELEKAGKKIYDPELHDPGDDGYDYVKMTGKMTAAAVYTAMYEHNGKMLLFDDCDSVLQDENAINLFKGALDTSGDGSIDWGSAKPLKDSQGNKIPGKFAFTGRAIFISNLDIGGKAGDAIQPIISRGYGINLAMDPKQTMQRIRHIASNANGQLTNLRFNGIPNYTHEDMKSVLDYMDKHRDKAADLNVRTVATLLAIKKDGDEAGVKWEDDAKYVYLRKSEDINIFDGGLIKMRQNHLEKALSRDGKTVEERKIEWCDMMKAHFNGNVTSEILK